MKKRLFSFISIVVGFIIALAAGRGHGDRLALSRGWPPHAGGRAVRAHPEHLRARHDPGHGLPLHRHALSASLLGVRASRQPAVRHLVGQQCRPVRPRLPDRQARRPLRRHDQRRFGRGLSRRQPETALSALSRGGAEQDPGSAPTASRWMVLDAAAGAWKEPQSFIAFAMYATAVDAIINLSGYNEHYYFQPKMDQRLEGPAANFLEANPFAADENFGDAAIGWVMGRIAGAHVDQPDPRQVARRLPAHSRHRGGRQGQGQLQVQQADDDPQPLRLAEGHPGQSATPVRRPARPLPEILSRDRGGGARQRREVGLFHAAHPGLGQDADRRRKGASSATWPTASSTAAWSPA